MSFHHPHPDQGARLNQQAHAAKSPAAKTGFFATLRAASLRANGTGAPALRRTSLALAPLLTLAALLLLSALSATSAQAEVTHEYLSQITGFESPAGLTVDSSSNLYVADAGEATLDRFDSAGAPLSFSASEPYVEGARLIGTPTGPGGAEEDFGTPTGVAVNDATGDIYVTDASLNVVDVFSSTGEYVSQLTGRCPSPGPCAPGEVIEFDKPQGLAFDQAAQDLYVTDANQKAIDVFSASGEYLSQVGAGTFGPQYGESIAVNEFSGDVYLGNSAVPHLTVFDSLGAIVSQWGGAATPAGSFGHHYVYVGMDQSTGQVYVLDSEHNVIDEFKPSAEEEYEGQVTNVAKGIGDAEIEGPRAIAVDPTNSDLYVAVLARGVSAVNVYGPDQVAPGVNTEAATAIAATTATLTGTVTPEGTQLASCKFEYGTTEALGTAIACAQAPGEIGNGAAPVPVSAEPTGLTMNSKYYFRLRGAYAEGANYGNIEEFRTLGAPQVQAESAAVESSNKAGQTQATLAAQIDPDGPETTYSFEYVTDAEFKASGYETATSAPVPPGAIAPGEEAVPVSVEASALQLATTYHYRVVASNEYGTVDGPDQTFTTLAAALVETSVADVAATSATLEAQVNPLGTDTTCEFQYVTEEAFQATAYAAAVSAPCPAGLGAGEAAVPASVHLNGLAPGTVYHYRVVATNALGVVAAPDQTFTTQAAGSALALPDARAWEMVSPPQKEGAQILGIGQYGNQQDLVQGSADGSAIGYTTTSPTEADPQSNSQLSQDLSRRAAGGGWSTTDIMPPANSQHEVGAGVGQGNVYRLFSSDLSLGVVQPFGEFLPLSPEASEQTAYLRTTYLNGNVEEPCLPATMHCYRPLVTGKEGFANVPLGTVFGGAGATHCELCGPQFVDATPDLSHVVLAAGGLTETQWTGGGGIELYEWSAGKPPSEQLQPLYLLPKSEGGEGVRSPQFAHPSPLAHQLSDDGSVFFAYGGHLYLHDAASGESGRLDLAQGVPNPRHGGVSTDGGFIYASSDGSRVLFRDSKQLTSAAGGGVYECRVVKVAGLPGCGGLELTGLSGEDSLVGGSQDASYLYFVGAGNELYVDHYDGSQWTRTSIAALSDADQEDWAGTLQHHSSRVSPNGQWLAFMSNQDLTGYDTRDALSGEPDHEVYLYDATAAGGKGALTCASCNPTGARPTGALLGGAGTVGPGHISLAGGEDREGWFAASIPNWTPISNLILPVAQTRYLSDSGRLFFNSHDALLPQDANATWDVYEYEPPGVGDCTTSSLTFGQRSGGCVGLISSGAGARESAFIEASETGGDVFFLSTAKLSPQDLDTAPDVYDAHACTASSPCPPPLPPSPPACSGDACQQPAVPPNDATPGSLTFQGAGNVVEKPAKKKHKHHKQKSHKKHAKKSHQRAASHNRGGHK